MTKLDPLSPENIKIDTYVPPETPGCVIGVLGVRVTHLPTGLKASSETERSQHANKEKAMSELRRLLDTTAPSSQYVKEVHHWDGGDRHNYAFTLADTVPDTLIKATWPQCSIVRKLLMIHPSIESVKANDLLTLKRQAWDALTPPQREAIGLKERP